jgi:membrane fusion protein (multidrug efflux system)
LPEKRPLRSGIFPENENNAMLLKMPINSSLRRRPSGAAPVLCMLAIAVALSACGKDKAPAPAAKPPEVSYVTVKHVNVPLSAELPGRTAPFLVAQVRSRVDGIVQKREFQEGADVRAGQPLYQIDAAPYRAALASAEANLQKASASLATTTAQLERYKVLIAGNAVSKQAYDNTVAAQLQAAAEVAAAKAAATTARINLGYTNVVAPIAGRSSVSQVTEGAYVQGSAATLLTTIQQTDPIYVDLQQSSAEGLQLRRALASGQLKGQADGKDGGQAKVTLTLEDGSDYPLAGALEFSGITVDPATGSVTMRARFPNPDHLLLPGMFVRAKLGQGIRQNALLVPASGVAHNPQGQATVMVLAAGDKVEQRTVAATKLVGSSWIIDSGLRDGERVLVSGIQRVKPGVVVKATQVATPATAGGAQGSHSAATELAAK